MKIVLTNKSDWPTPLVKVLAAWVCKREGLGNDRPYKVTVKNCRSGKWGGRGGSFGQRVWLDVRYQPASWENQAKRRGWPLMLKDHRYQWAKTYEYRNRLEVLVMLLAHEAHHATAGHPNEFRERSETPEGDTRYRINRDSMEFRCDEAGHEAVEAFRAEFPALRDKIRQVMAADRERTKAKRTALKLRRSDPNPKLAKAEAMFDKWQRKQKVALNKMRKYQRQIRYYSGKVAAASGQSK